MSDDGTTGEEFDPEDAFGHDVLDPTGAEADRWVDGDDDDIDV